jgi:hypothetical protein
MDIVKYLMVCKCIFINCCVNFSLLVGQGAHEYGISNNIIAVDPLNLISGTYSRPLIRHLWFWGV